MKNKLKLYLTLWVVLFTFLNVNAQCEIIMKFFKDDVYTSKELVAFAEKDPQKAFDSWKILYNEKTGLTKSIEELNLVFKNLDEINAIGYSKWKAVSGAGKAGLLTKFKDFANVKTWINSLDDIADASLLSKLDNLEKSYFTKLDADLVHATYGSEIKALLKESPDDLVDVWKKLKDDPAFSWELQKTGGSRWEK